MRTDDFTMAWCDVVQRAADRIENYKLEIMDPWTYWTAAEVDALEMAKNVIFRACNRDSALEKLQEIYTACITAAPTYNNPAVTAGTLKWAAAFHRAIEIFSAVN